MQNMKICLVLLIVAAVLVKQSESKLLLKKLAAVKAPLIGAKIVAAKDVGNQISDAVVKNVEAARATGRAVKSVVLLPVVAAKKVAAAKIVGVKALKALKVKKLLKAKKLLSGSKLTATAKSDYQGNQVNAIDFDASARLQLPNIEIPDNVQLSLSTNTNGNSGSYFSSFVPDVISRYVSSSSGNLFSPPDVQFSLTSTPQRQYYY